jgi:histidine ammonia-lyase
MTDNAAHIVAIELLAAAQGIELRRPLQSSAPLEAALARVRTHAAFLIDDRPLAGEIRAVAGAILEDAFAFSS